MLNEKRLSNPQDSLVVVDANGEVTTFENTIGKERSDALLNYYSADWKAVLENGDRRDVSKGRKEISWNQKATTCTITQNSDGTFAQVRTEWVTPGNWMRETVTSFDAWTTEAKVLLPRKMDWQTYLIDGKLKIPLVDSQIRLLMLDNISYIND